MAKILVVAGILATVLHFADNTIFIARYPEPDWITPQGVVVSWCAATLLAIVALTRKTADAIFFAASGIYALILLGGLLHYRFGSPMQMPIRSNVTVLVEAAVGIALGGALLASRIKSR